MTEDELNEFATRYTAAWCSQDPHSVAACFAENASLKINGGAPSTGRAEIAEVARGFMLAFPDLNIQLDRLDVQPDRVDYHWTLTGTNNGPDGTGNAVRICGCEEWALGADGLIAASQGRFDEDDYQRQLQAG